MSMHEGLRIVRHAEIAWEERVNVDGWPCRAGMYQQDEERGITMRLIDYPKGSIEPRHVHAGTHATTLLKGHALIDGITMQPLDVVIGPGGEPHGPLDYQDGRQLLSAFIGDYFHGEVEQLAETRRYRLVQQEQIPWQPLPGGIGERKALAERVADRLRVEVLRLRPGALIPAGGRADTEAYLVLEGSARAGGATLGVWDFAYLPDGTPGAEIAVPNGGSMLRWVLAK